MRRVMFLILALATLLPTMAQAYEILVLQSSRDAGYETVLKGFHSGANPSERIIVLSDYAELDIVRIVREDRPTVILAIGDAALATARKVHDTPVVAVMSLGIHTPASQQPNLTGIDMFAPPARYIDIFKSMKTRRVGVLYNPARCNWYLRLARRAAEAAGIELVTREVFVPRQTIAQLATLAGKVDALWMLPDSTAVTRETIEAYFDFGQQQNIPVISFAANYLGLGAAAVLEIDRLALGRQADSMVSAILRANHSGHMALGFPNNIQVKTNPGILRRLNIHL
ncbi:MAG: ABC transporter substrate binding protein [Geobacteraceae bacterium]|nr:ABC transporter substrate binding protein [Geobacteraceae bacterium]